VGLKQTNTF